MTLPQFYEAQGRQLSVFTECSLQYVFKKKISNVNAYHVIDYVNLRAYTRHLCAAIHLQTSEYAEFADTQYTVFSSGFSRTLRN